MSNSKSKRGPLLTQRATLIILLSVIVAVSAGILTYFVQPSLAAAFLAGGAAGGAAIQVFDKMVGT